MEFDVARPGQGLNWTRQGYGLGAPEATILLKLSRSEPGRGSHLDRTLNSVLEERWAMNVRKQKPNGKKVPPRPQPQPHMWLAFPPSLSNQSEEGKGAIALRGRSVPTLLRYALWGFLHPDRQIHPNSSTLLKCVSQLAHMPLSLCRLGLVTNSSA